MDKRKNPRSPAAAVNNLFWINGFDNSAAGSGVSAKFKTYMRSHGYCSETDYFCALNEHTPSTAIAKSAFDAVCRNQGSIYLGRYNEHDGSWRVFQLDNTVIQKKFQEKCTDGKDGSRLNISDKTDSAMDITADVEAREEASATGGRSL